MSVLSSKLFSSCILLILAMSSFHVVEGFSVSPMNNAMFRNKQRGNKGLEMTQQQLSEIDSMCVMNTAVYCSEGECTVDEIDALINQLKDQRDIFKMRMKKMDIMLNELDQANHVGDERDVDFLRKTMLGKF